MVASCMHFLIAQGSGCSFSYWVPLLAEDAMREDVNRADGDEDMAVSFLI